MCYWDALCDIGVPAWQPRSRVKEPRNPSNELKWLQIQKRRQLFRSSISVASSCRQCRGRDTASADQWDLWHNRNRKICSELANKLDMTVCEVSDLLFNLTFQNYGKILNPVGDGWNVCRVPLCVANVGHCYLDIFDLEGNLRNPTDPKSLYNLLRFLQSVAQSDPNSDVLKREYVKSLETPLTTNFMYDPKLGALVDSSATDYKLETKKTVQDTHDMLVNRRRRKVEIYKKTKDENSLFDEWGRRFGYGSSRLNTLRKNGVINIIKKYQKGDPVRFLMAIRSVIMPVKKKKDKESVKHISDFYTKVVDEDEVSNSNFVDIMGVNISYLPGERRTSLTKSIYSVNSIKSIIRKNSLEENK